MMAEQALKADKETIAAHLSHLTRRWHEIGQPCLIETVFLTAADKAEVRNVARFRPDVQGIADAAQHIAAMNAHKLNAYAVVNPLRGNLSLNPPPGTRASKEDIICSFYHFADADKQESTERIMSFVGPKCTFSVLTGTIPHARPHIYWELEKPEWNLPEWTERQRSIAATFLTDAVIDAPRMMRVAGTVNWPKPDKQSRGYIAEVTTLRIFDRSPVPVDQIARAFAVAPQATSGSFSIEHDTGSRVDPEVARINAMSGEEWHNNVIRMVAHYVGRGWSDDEIHRQTVDLTLPGYTAEQTRREVQVAIDGARKKGWTPQKQFAPNFDHSPAPTASDPAPQSAAWKLQTSAEFVSDFVAPEYIVDGVIRRGMLYTLTAPTGSGKTAVMLYASCAIAEGMDFADREVEPGDVIFMAGENPDDVRARHIAMMESLGIDEKRCRVHFIAGTFSIRADFEAIRAAAEKLPNLVLIIIDTFAAYFDGDDENSNAQALDFARVARKLTTLQSKPAVVMPAHPVKNAARNNLSPKGGSSLVNEVDGNLTLWNDGGVVTMHWQVKFRGAEFDPLTFELQRYETDRIRDAKGRLMPTILAKPVLQMRAMELAAQNLTAEDRILISVHRDPAISLAERAVQCGLGHKQKAARILQRLQDQKLVRRFRTNWELTADGERAVRMIENGDGFAPEVGL
jgi:hypothetical protein